MYGLHGVQDPPWNWVLEFIGVCICAPFSKERSKWIWKTQTFQNKWLKERRETGKTEASCPKVSCFADWTSCTWLHHAPKVTRGDWGVSKDWNFVSRLAISLLAVPTYQTKSYTEPTYTKLGQSKDALGEVGLIPNHRPLSSPTLVSPEDQGPPSNTAGKSYAQHSWVCELTVFLNLYPLHSVQNCSSAPLLWTKSPLATVRVSSQTHPHENHWFCLSTMKSSRHCPRPPDSEPLGTTHVHKLRTHCSCTFEFGVHLRALAGTPTKMQSASPEPTRKPKTEPEGDGKPRPGCPWLQGEQQLSVPWGDNPPSPVCTHSDRCFLGCWLFVF